MKIEQTHFFPSVKERTLTNNIKCSLKAFLLMLFIFATLSIIPDTAFAKGKRVTVFDRGMNMARATYLLPKGWKLDYDIATSPISGQFDRYQLDKLGPKGEIARAIKPVLYGPFQRISLQNAWRQTANNALRGILTQTQLGQPQQQGPLITKIMASKMLRQVMKKNGVTKLYEIDISGKRNGKRFEGKILAAIVPFDNQSGSLSMGITLSPKGLLMKTIDTNIKITESIKPNLKYSRKIQKISKNYMAQMTNQHNKRMANNKRQFNAHQNKMKGIYQSNDRRNKQWMDNFRNSGSSSKSNNGYSSQDAYIDNIYERNTFKDPSTGNNVSREGQYKYNYTDGTGRYYGTDDPSFNSNSMQGDWRATEPLNPN